MANESTPSDPLPADFVPAGFVDKHRVADGEDWASVAKQYGVAVDALIYFNFHTNVPEEVNWYLRRNTGCDVSNDGGVNWAFSSSADPGIIYIPPAKVINMDPEDIQVDKPVMQRIQEIAAVTPGRPGDRMRSILALESLADPYQATPAAPGLQKERLWYYTPGIVSYYINSSQISNMFATDVDRKGMTKDTNGQFPFDGDVGPGFEQVYHQWRIYPFGDIVARDANNHISDSELKIWLDGTGEEIYQSWEDMARVDGRYAAGGGGSVSQMVVDFLKHVHDLAATPTHLYSVYQNEAQS